MPGGLKRFRECHQLFFLLAERIHLPVNQTKCATPAQAMQSAGRWPIQARFWLERASLRNTTRKGSHPDGPRFLQRAEGSRAHRNRCPGSNCTATFPVGDSISLAYNYMMQISLEPNLEARLNQIASEAGKAANQVVEELVANYIDHDAWFKQEVNKGLLSLDTGKFVSHDDVRRRIDQILGS